MTPANRQKLLEIEKTLLDLKRWMDGDNGELTASEREHVNRQLLAVEAAVVSLLEEL